MYRENLSASLFTDNETFNKISGWSDQSLWSDAFIMVDVDAKDVKIEGFIDNIDKSCSLLSIYCCFNEFKSIVVSTLRL